MRMTVLLLTVITIIAGCSVNHYSSSGRSFDHHAERQYNFSSSLQPGGKLCTTNNLTHMDITVTGQDTTTCTVLAELSVSATSQEIADAVIDQIEVSVEHQTELQAPDRLVLIVNKPQEYKDEFCVSGKMTITVPSETALDLATTYGDCRIEQIQSDVDVRSTHGNLAFDGLTGQIVAKTTYGDITVDRTQAASAKVTTSHAQIRVSDCTVRQLRCGTTYGDIRLTGVSAKKMDLSTTHSSIELNRCMARKATLNTSYGQIRGEVRQVEQVTARTSHAPINLHCVNEASPNILATLNTTYGDIEFCPPAGFAGSVSASTSYGQIRSDQPVLVQGVIGDKLNGTIGQGDGSISMTSSHGDITLK